ADSGGGRGEQDSSRLVRLLRTTLEAGFAHPSRLLTYYLKRLVQRPPLPLAALEVLWQLAAELAVPLYEEEHAQGAALQQAIDALWTQLPAAAQSLTTLVQVTAAQARETSPEFQAVCAHLMATTPGLDHTEAVALLRYLVDWLRSDVPSISSLIKTIERTQIHAFLAANDDLSLTRPAYLTDAAMVAHLQSVLSRSLRPTLLRHGELLSPMEATIYHQPEPGAPTFVEVGDEVNVGLSWTLL